MKITNLSRLTFIYWEQSIGWIDLTKSSITVVSFKKSGRIIKITLLFVFFRLDLQREEEDPSSRIEV